MPTSAVRYYDSWLITIIRATFGRVVVLVLALARHFLYYSLLLLLLLLLLRLWLILLTELLTTVHHVVGYKAAVMFARSYLTAACPCCGLLANLV